MHDVTDEAEHVDTNQRPEVTDESEHADLNMKHDDGFGGEVPGGFDGGWSTAHNGGAAVDTSAWDGAASTAAFGEFHDNFHGEAPGEASGEAPGAASVQAPGAATGGFDGGGGDLSVVDMLAIDMGRATVHTLVRSHHRVGPPGRHGIVFTRGHCSIVLARMRLDSSTH